MHVALLGGAGGHDILRQRGAGGDGIDFAKLFILSFSVRGINECTTTMPTCLVGCSENDREETGANGNDEVPRGITVTPWLSSWYHDTPAKTHQSSVREKRKE